MDLSRLVRRAPEHLSESTIHCVVFFITQFVVAHVVVVNRLGILLYNRVNLTEFTV